MKNGMLLAMLALAILEGAASGQSAPALEQVKQTDTKTITTSADAVATSRTALTSQEPRTQFHQIDVKEKPVIDGLLNDALWSNAPIIDDFHQTRPNDHGTPSERTEVQIARTNEFVYIAFKAFDSEVATLSAKGFIQGQTFFSDDRVGVNLDTFDDRRNSYFFQVNGNGIRRDALVGNDYFIDDWNTIWYAETKVHDWGWSGEIAIPVKSIAFDPNIDQWGINFGRVHPRRGEEMVWSSSDRNSGPAVSGYINGVRGFDQGLGLELAPSLSVGYSDNSESSDTSFEPSLTSFYNITPFLTAGLTLNTDFSATEVDERQINLGRFSLFFPEKRDFFLRDASIFEFGGIDTNARPFFSRRIGLAGNGTPLDLDVGLKLSGRAGDWNIGALAIQQETIEPGADDKLFVGRVTRNIFNESELGFITTLGDPNSNSDNRLAGVDYTYRNSQVFGDQQLRANLWYQQSDSLDVNDEQSAFGATLSYPNYKYDGFIDIRRIEENFNPAIGFVNRTGVDQAEGRFRRRFRIQNNFVDWVGARVQFLRSDRIGGGVQTDRRQYNVFEARSHKNDFFTIFAIDQTENLLRPFTLPGGLDVPIGNYSFKRYGVYFETGSQRQWSFEFEYANGDFFNGKRESIEPEIYWRPNKHFFGSVAFRNNKIDLPSGSFTSKLFSARANVAFNSKWAWLNLVQGDNVSDTVSVNSRIRYQPRADREYFLVLNQNFDRESEQGDDFSIIFKASFNYQL